MFSYSLVSEGRALKVVESCKYLGHVLQSSTDVDNVNITEPRRLLFITTNFFIHINSLEFCKLTASPFISFCAYACIFCLPFYLYGYCARVKQ
jgi:hypothetical protein